MLVADQVGKRAILVIYTHCASSAILEAPNEMFTRCCLEPGVRQMRCSCTEYKLLIYCIIFNNLYKVHMNLQIQFKKKYRI